MKSGKWRVTSGDQPAEPTSRELGYRMPAEWEPQSHVWVSRPHNAATWPGCLEQAQRQFDHFVGLLQNQVNVLDLRQSGVVTNDSWIRDFGPFFVVRGASSSPLASHDFRFNGWGKKYSPWDADDEAGRQISRRLNIPRWTQPQVLEGGAIDTNGRGTLIAAESCVRHQRRNPRLSRDRAEKMLHDALAADHVIWLPGGIAGDDTDGHVDTVARFIDTTTIAAVRAPQEHPDHISLEQNWNVLQNARDRHDRPLSLVELPAPRPITVNLPAASEYNVARAQLPASYANFLICNGAVFVPAFNQPTDATALVALERAMPEYQMIPVRCDRLILGLGTIHCLTLSQPAVVEQASGLPQQSRGNKRATRSTTPQASARSRHP